MQRRVFLHMLLVCRHQDKDDVGGGKGQRRSEPRGDVHTYRFVRLPLAFSTTKLIVITQYLRHYSVQSFTAQMQQNA